MEDAPKPYRAFVGVKTGTPLGNIAVKPAGFALTRTLKGRAWDKWVDTARVAQASTGVPVGAGNFGLVRSTRSDGAAIKDFDLDGVPDPLDIDDDGDLILDGYDTSTRAGAAQADGTFPDGSRMSIPHHCWCSTFHPSGP